MTGARTADFDYRLPPELIAQRPLKERSASRLLVLDRAAGKIEHRVFTDLLEYLKPGDCLVVNETKVRPARLLGRKTTGAAVEVLLLSEETADTWEALCRPAKRLPAGARIVFGDQLTGEVVQVLGGGKRLVKFSSPAPLAAALDQAGRLALPPYIREPLDEASRYQTVFARAPGSAAAPTAGLHFTRSILRKIEAAGIKTAKLTLDIGLDTFRPIQTATLDDHQMHSEVYEIPQAAVALINTAQGAGHRVAAVGTTTVRALESAGAGAGTVKPGRRSTSLFIRPGYRFKVVDLMLTNFHLPKSTLLVLVSAFAGRELIRRAYAEAIERRYRFYSFGDTMLII